MATKRRTEQIDDSGDWQRFRQPWTAWILAAYANVLCGII